jgi:hypothetical protein
MRLGPLISLAVLLTYAVQVLGGMGWHALLDSCECSGCPAPNAEHAHADCDGHSHHHPHSHQQPSDKPAEPEHHDASECPICQVMGLVVVVDAPPAIQCSGTVTPACDAGVPSLFAAATSLGFQSRAPPTA